MFRKRTRLTSQVWTVIFLLLFNDALAQTTTESVAKISLEEPSKVSIQNRTVLRKLVEDRRTKISSDEKHESIFTNSTNFQDEIERSSTREASKQKDLNNESIIEEKIETDEKPVISTGKTFDSLDRTISTEPTVKSKLSKNNVSDKTLKLVPDDESLPKLPRNKSKQIFLEAFKEGTRRHNVKKSEIISPEFEVTDDYEIEEHDLEHKEPTTQPTTKRKESLEDFDIEASKREDKNDDKDEGANEDDSLSLVNDTNVNFKQTAKNETNLISENDDSIDMEFGPKNDVEVVQNITRSPIMRIVQAAEENKGFVNNDKSFINKKINVKLDNGKNFTKKIEGDSIDSVNDVNLKNDEKVKIDISSKPLPSTKIEISANADIPSFKLDISSSKIDISSTKPDASSKVDAIPSKTEVSSSEIDIFSTKPDRSLSKIDILSPKTDGLFTKVDPSISPSSKVDILPSNTYGLSSNTDGLSANIDGSLPKEDDLSSKANGLPSKTEDLSSKIDGPSPKAEVLPSKEDGSSSKIDILPSQAETLSSKLEIISPKMVVPLSKEETPKIDATSFKEDLSSKSESLSKITSSSISNSSWIKELPKSKDNSKTKESTDNFADITNTNDNVSPAPRARTISFTGINQFIPENIDSKAVTTRTTVIESPVTKRPFQLDKELELKPYPYLKTDIKKTIDESEEADKVSGFGKRIEETTEEASAYDNTIGRKGSDKKLVYTEPSVVIENSIQFKPTYYKRSGNSTKFNSTISEFEIQTTSESAQEDNITGSHVSTPSADNDFVNKEFIHKIQVTDKEQKIDFAENGITETNLLNVTSTNKKDVSDSLEKITKVTDEDIGVEKVKEKSTESPKESKTKSSFESKKNSDTSESDKGAKMGANTTESSTQHSITNKIEVTESSLTGSTKGVLNTEKAEIFSTTQVLNLNKSDVNVNNIIQTSSMLPETTTVEYEFVGLKETTVPEEENYKSSEGIVTSTESYKSSEIKPVTDARKLTESNSSIVTDTVKSTVPDISTDESSDDPTQFGKTTDSDKINDYSKSNNSSKIVDYSTTVDSSKTTDTSKIVDSGKATDSDKTTISEESSTFSYVLRDGTTESNTLSSNEETTIIISTEETVTDVSESVINKYTTSTDRSSVGRSTSEDKSSLEVETMKPEETINLLTTTLISNQDVTQGTTVSYDETTNVADIKNSSDGELLKKNTSSVDFTETEVTSEAPIKKTVQQFTTTDTTLMWTSTSSLNPRIVSVTSESTVSKSITEAPTTAMPTLAPEDISVFVRIVFEGTWGDVCPHLESMRQMIAKLLTTGSDRLISSRQVIFYQTQCMEGVMALTSMSSSETPLTSLLIYIVDEDGYFDESMTKLLPNLYKVSMPTIDFPLPVHSFLLVQETDSGNAIAVIVVSSVAFICLVLLAGLLFIMRKRQTRFNYGERCRPVSLDAYSLDSVSAYNSVRRKGAIRASKRSYGNPTFEDSSAIPSHPLNFAGLSSFCNDVNAISEEFAGIPQIIAKIDELPQGAEVKNRYANVIPLPETRVPLQRLNNDLLTEYINASYVRGPKNATKYYIACQAPTESSVTDFWRMIWEQQSKVIIMLTDLVENGVEKCSEYIPPSEVTDCHRLYGDYQVTLKKRETKEKYAISTLHLKNLENNTFREVSHIWYLWPANGMPDSVSLIAVLLEARALQRGGPGPIVVHCSPGTGRTGTLIALDLGIRQYEITRTVDVPRVVYTIRRDRAGAVQTKEQYAFIYKALNLYATKLSGGALEST